MSHTKIGFIGGGNMARSIIGGLSTESGAYDIYVSDPDCAALTALRSDFGIQPCKDNAQLLATVDIVILAVKPQLMQQILTPLSEVYQQNRTLIISIAAGITSNQIISWLQCGQAPCIRVMPNTPALVQSGASGLYAVNCDPNQKQMAQEIMNAVGITVWVENENLIDTVTAVSGSGPAYFFYLMEAVFNAAVSNGLDASVAKTLTLQTALGAAKLAKNSEADFKTLRKQVTSPGGTTEAAIGVLKQQGFSDSVEKAVTRAARRSKELSEG